MTQTLLLVDFENVQTVDLGRLDETCDVVIFVGASQKHIPVELVRNAQELGGRVQWKRVDAHGKNALDFFIACELGSVAERETKPQCIVLSKDKGFDPLLRHLKRNGLNCERKASLSKPDPVADDANCARIVEILRKQPGPSRPRKRKSLAAYIAAQFQNKLEASEVERITTTLFSEKVVCENSGKLIYKFQQRV